MSEELIKVTLLVELTYDQGVMHDSDPEAVAWFNNDVLGDPELVLHSNEIGDSIGTVRVIGRPAPAVLVPEGWKLVPVRPTLAMKCAGGNALHMMTNPAAKAQVSSAVYRAMVAAATNEGEADE